MNSTRNFYGLLSLLTLIAGIGIYFLFRDLKNIVLFTWIPKLEFPKAVLVPLNPSTITNFLRYHLTDMLWFISGILFLRFIWFYKIKIQRVYVLCFYGIGFALETSQLSEKVPGTFDWLDLLCMGTGAFIEGLLYKFFIIRRLA
jgi:hypothetical protein